MTEIQKARYLSRGQNKRFAGLFTINLGFRPYEDILASLIFDKYAIESDHEIKLTERGVIELQRLAFFCGVLITKEDINPMRFSYVDPDNPVN